MKYSEAIDEIYKAVDDARIVYDGKELKGLIGFTYVVKLYPERYRIVDEKLVARINRINGDQAELEASADEYCFECKKLIDLTKRHQFMQTVEKIIEGE